MQEKTKNMNEKEKSDFYSFNKHCIQPVIKSDPISKPLWRRLFWSTARDSLEYKCGCVDILMEHFPYLFNELLKSFKTRLKGEREGEC